MANYYLCLFIFRIVLPIILGACIVFRPSGLSAIYFLFLFCLPLTPIPTVSSMAGRTGIYLKFMIAMSFLTAITQLSFQIVLLSMPPYAHFLERSKNLEKILRQVGLVKLDKLDVVSVITWISPEIVMLITSIGTYIICHKLLQKGPIEEAENEENLPRKAKTGKKKVALLVAIGKYAVLIALCVAAVLRPSIQGGLYFLVFLSSATWWACYKQLRKGFAIMMRCLSVIVICHMIALYIYQFEWTQENLPPNSSYARYFGLRPIFNMSWINSTSNANSSSNANNNSSSNNSIYINSSINGNSSNNTNGTSPDPRIFVWSSEEWATYVNPIALFLLYYILVLESKFLLKPQSQKKQGPFSRLEGSFTQPMSRQLSQRLSANKHLMRSATTRNKWKNATRKVRRPSMNYVAVGETTPLIRGVSPSRRYGSGTRKAPSVLQDSVGSVTVTGDNPDDIPMSPLGKGATEEDYNPTVLENIMFALESLLQLIIKSSYVVTNIIMMAWSITYLSWITFVLLLWANLLWLVPNQRKSMLRSSPFLVIYAWFLLISAYIYSMDLNENELPSTIEGIDMNELGFQRETDLPCNPLLVKCLFTAMFWITLRQYMQERLAEKQNNALADMVAPLQVTVGTAAGVNNEQEQGSKLMDKIGKYLRKLLTKFWIWVVAITLFAVAITGERMTGFRVIYMALFLVFILSFQISFRGWRKMMFGFWLTVIVYSMIILVMVYTYQFKNFKNYWSDYLHVPEKQQMDIGLEKFDKTQLFVRLLTPTFFVIITVIQLHYFHKDFMEMSDPKNASIIGVELDQSSLQGGAAAANSDKDETITSSLKYDLTETDTPKTKWQLWQRRFHYGMDICYLFLELHMPKFVLLFLMLACVYDKCALYLILIILIVLACTIGRPMQIFAIYCSSFFVSLMLLARMIYQIEYIDEAKWNVTCDIANKTEVQNNTKWLGFYKVHKDTTLPHLVKWNIIYILVVTLWAVVLVRQFNYRVSRGKPTVRAFFMFPKITRNDADKNLSNCIKYLFNYGFYKFGVEICLMATVALIGFRMDMYSVIYSIWLCILFNLKRKTLAKVWNCYMIFIALLLPLQYVMTVGLPPTLCIVFPWDKEFWNEGEEQKAELFRRLQDWAYLLDTQIPPSPKKLICDFILLLLVSRQSVVFRIEKRYAGQEYNGGSNDSIIHYAEEKGFVNPVPDFISTVRSYLDVFKKAVFSSFLWITLAIVFLAGTNRVNLFSIGYLVGAFIFLWQGTDLYLRPIPKILKSWNLFLGYNVTVILIKTALQIVGCIFIKEIPNSSCWLIQLFGIGCVRKFGDLSLQAGHEDAQNCKVPREFVGLVWDGLCFGFMITQRRLFQSYNFFHLIDEIKAGTILASRGAELIEELRLKRMTEQDEQERRVLEKIKAKMDKIKANQQKIQGASYKDSENHYTDQPPLAHSSSMSSCASATSQQTSPAGYHTPIDDEEHAPLTPRSSLLQQQAPSPYSAVMTVSLEGYLEPQRMSFSSPPNSELNPRPPSPDDSFPVFSPPPYDAAPPYAEAVSEPPAAVQRQTSIGPPWMQGSFVTPRQSVISYSSRSPLSHHEYTIFKGRPKRRRREPKSYKQAVRSGDYYMFDDLDDDEELDFMEEPKPDEDDEYRGQTVGQLLSTAMKTDIGTTVRQHSLIEVKRRASMPLARQKSVVSARSQISAPYSAPPIIDEHVQRSVKIIDDRRKSDEPQPSTSKDDDVSESGEKEENLRQKICNYFLFVCAFIQSSIISLTNFLNKYSKDYRYVLRVLAKEKKILKENTDYSVGLRLGSGQVWQPATSYNSLLRQSREESVIPTPSAGTFSPSDSYRLALVEDRMASEREDKGDVKSSISEDSDTKALATTLPYTSEQDRRKASVLTVPEIRILAPSLERGLDSPFPSPESSHLDMEEYDVTEMSSYDQPPIIRLLLAIWHIIMSRSENVCYFIVFLNQIKSATFLSLPLPLMVFLWGTLTIPRPNKNFWVTIIAYTEVIVLIKCMFQFDIIPWNMSQAVTNNPFYPPRIIGIERNKYYAVWDLLLLLVVFFHRFMLKSMGLWKTSPTPAALLEEGTYKVTSEGKLEPLDDVSSKVRKRIRHLSNIKYKDERRTTPSQYSKLSLKLKKVKTFFKKSLKSSKNGKSVSSRGSPASRASDLQRLVEESEDPDEDKKDGSIMSTVDSEMENKVVLVQSEVVEPMSHLPQSVKMALMKYGESCRLFFKQLRDPTSRVAADVYSYMFLCDFYNFFVILIGYSSFGTQQGDEGVSSYLEDNRVPVLFLLMLILQFTLIIVDRGIFLRKNILAKIIFQFIQVIILHIWLFILFPIITERGFNSVIAPQMYYMVKCFYLLLSAYQIRCGYPTRILGNFLCKGYNYVNMFLFKAFMAVPFLFELRTVMDWMWTDTSMTVFDWIKMEDIFAHIFQLKCTRHVEDEYPQPRGERKTPVIKYLMGGAILALIIAIIWFPLVFFSLGNAVGEPNPPYDVTLELRIGPYEPVYQMSAQSNSIFQFTESNLVQLQQLYAGEKNAATFISNYEALDIAAVKLSSDSANIWSISPPDRKRMVIEVNSTDPLSIRLEYKVSHKTSKPEDSGVIPDNVEIQIPALINGKANPMRQNLLKMLEGDTNQTMLLKDILPKFLKVTNRGTAKPVSQLMVAEDKDSDAGKSFRTISLSLGSSTVDGTKEWWKIQEACNDTNYEKFLSHIPYKDCDSIILYTFNDKIFPSTLNILTGGGIVGLYTTLVFVASRFLRGFFADQCFKIMFEDMPYIDRVLQLCLDIYLVREAREFALEEDLFAKLVFLFRSPETMIKWTRPKEELADDEDPEGDA